MEIKFVLVLIFYILNTGKALEFVKKCRIIKDCPQVIELVQIKPLTEDNRKYLKSLQCNDETKVLRVMCNIKENEVLAKIMKEGKCSESIFNRLVVAGGDDSHVGEFPWIAMLEYRNKKNKLQPKCGGSLISEKYVLTAAHCLVVDERTAGKLESVLLGEFDTYTKEDCKISFGLEANEPKCEDITKRYAVESFVVHPFYEDSAKALLFHHDIGLVKLKEPVQYSKYIGPICLPLEEFEVRNSKNRYTVAGWGLTEEGFASTKLQKLSVPFYDSGTCTKFLKYNITNNQFCAGGETGKDSCKGDSGGPLIYYGRQAVIQVGIVSLSIGKSCGTGRPNIYINVKQYINWINDNVDE